MSLELLGTAFLDANQMSRSVPRLAFRTYPLTDVPAKILP